MASCLDTLPSTPTIVKGKIVDENGDPLEGAGLRLTGVNLKGFSGYDTFSITTESDRNGMYELSHIVPKNTEQISIASRNASIKFVALRASMTRASCAPSPFQAHL